MADDIRKARPQETADGLGHGAKTDAVRERAVLALLTRRTIGEAAKAAKVGERTLRRWLTEDDRFRADYAEARRSVFEAALGRVQALTVKAVETLEELLGASDHPNVRLGAARTLVELGLHERDADIILSRLDELEARAPGRGGR